MSFKAKEHKEPKDCQVLIAITGTSEGIERELIRILDDIQRHGKPMQGIVISHDAIKEVITPVWNKSKY